MNNLAQYVKLRVLRNPEPDNAADTWAERVAQRLALDPADLPTSAWIGKGVPPVEERGKLAVRLNNDGTLYGFGVFTGESRTAGCCSEGGWQWMLVQDLYRLTPNNIPEGFTSTEIELVALSQIEEAIDATIDALGALRDWAQEIAPEVDNAPAQIPTEVSLALSKLQNARADIGRKAMTVVKNAIL
jgi:hypothetical protein